MLIAKYTSFCELYTKAFDICQHGKMMEALKATGIDTKDMQIISNLYLGQNGNVRIEGRQSVGIYRGVRRGCV